MTEDHDDTNVLLRDRSSRVARLLDRHGADALVLSTAENLAWITCGGDLLVSREGAPIAVAVARRDGMLVVTDRIEAPRLEAEVLPPGTELDVVEWHQPGARAQAVAARLARQRVLRDDELDLATLRLPLHQIERQRMQRAGRDASSALTDAAGRLEPGMTEHEVAARVHGSLRAAGLELPVVLIAGERRFARFRHPIVTGASFGAFGLIVVCAQRHGLITSLSRIVAFGEPPEQVRARLDAVLRVEAAMLDATRPDVATNEVLFAAQAAYREIGHAEAWRDHHQGGPAGYRPREWLATPSETRPLPSGTPVAWNPSLPLAKSEDTFMLDDSVLVNLSWDDRWPALEVAGRRRADVRVL